MVLECGVGRRGRIPFRSKNMWLQAEGFVEQVKRWCDSYDFEGNPSCVGSKVEIPKG